MLYLSGIDSPANLIEHMEEVRIRPDVVPPTRDELSALCDALGTTAEIAAAAPSSHLSTTNPASAVPLNTPEGS
jgi:hypothetical protein